MVNVRPQNVWKDIHSLSSSSHALLLEVPGTSGNSKWELIAAAIHDVINVNESFTSYFAEITTRTNPYNATQKICWRWWKIWDSCPKRDIMILWLSSPGLRWHLGLLEGLTRRRMCPLNEGASQNTKSQIGHRQTIGLCEIPTTGLHPGASPTPVDKCSTLLSIAWIRDSISWFWVWICWVSWRSSCINSRILSIVAELATWPKPEDAGASLPRYDIQTIHGIFNTHLKHGIIWLTKWIIWARSLIMGYNTCHQQYCIGNRTYPDTPKLWER